MEGRLTASKLHANVNYILISFEQFGIFYAISDVCAWPSKFEILLLCHLVFMHNSFCIALTPIIIIITLSSLAVAG